MPEQFNHLVAALIGVPMFVAEVGQHILYGALGEDHDVAAALVWHGGGVVLTGAEFEEGSDFGWGVGH